MKKEIAKNFFTNYEKYTFKYYKEKMIFGYRNTIEFGYYNDDKWFSYMNFVDKKDWYRFVRAVNNCNKLIKKWELENIEVVK